MKQFVLTNELLLKAQQVAVRNGFKRIMKGAFEKYEAVMKYTMIENDSDGNCEQQCVVLIDFRTNKRNFIYRVYDNPRRVQLDNGEEFQMDKTEIRNPQEFIDLFPDLF